MANDDLVARLEVAVTYGYMPRRMREVASEAATRITTLEAELKTALDREEATIFRYGAMLDRAGAELAMLRDENAKLRAANAALVAPPPQAKEPTDD
jgi:3-hydroxyisobutyrate dehydrogenase-like beta-hydroxyacid dehydrogenase